GRTRTGGLAALRTAREGLGACRGHAEVDPRPRGLETMTDDRLLSGFPRAHAIDLAEHVELHGELPQLGRHDTHDFIAAVEASGLRGRGGAGFPTAAKLAAVAARRRPVVVVNGAEAEPMSSKDRVLLELVPHL